MPHRTSVRCRHVSPGALHHPLASFALPRLMAARLSSPCNADIPGLLPAIASAFPCPNLPPSIVLALPAPPAAPPPPLPAPPPDNPAMVQPCADASALLSSSAMQPANPCVTVLVAAPGPPPTAGTACAATPCARDDDDDAVSLLSLLDETEGVPLDVIPPAACSIPPNDMAPLAAPTAESTLATSDDTAPLSALEPNEASAVAITTARNRRKSLIRADEWARSTKTAGNGGTSGSGVDKASTEAEGARQCSTATVCALLEPPAAGSTTPEITAGAGVPGASAVACGTAEGPGLSSLVAAAAARAIERALAHISAAPPGDTGDDFSYFALPAEGPSEGGTSHLPLTTSSPLPPGGVGAVGGPPGTPVRSQCAVTAVNTRGVGCELASPGTPSAAVPLLGSEVPLGSPVGTGTPEAVADGSGGWLAGTGRLLLDDEDELLAALGGAAPHWAGPAYWSGRPAFASLYVGMHTWM